jgi:hypothetical protein
MSGGPAYPAAERWLHRIAFATLGAQRDLSAMEDRLFAGTLAAVEVEAPVYVTGLPRAGTTVLLEILATSPEFAFHTYRCMPFVLCPLFWNRVSRPFRRPARAQERAHGDGTLIGYDSPEAFEEIIWKLYWPRHYAKDCIEPWSGDERDGDFERFLRAHMRKLVAGFGSGHPERAPRRYLAKNNASIARIALLARLFPACRIVIPFREPRGHVASLMRQHARFTALHAADRFALDYMNWLGHYEFGAALRPINFGGWCGETKVASAGSADFWLTYWTRAYAAILEAPRSNVLLFDYDGACAAPRGHLERLAAALGVRDPGAMLAAAGERLRAPTSHDDAVLRGASPALLARADELHERLRENVAVSTTSRDPGAGSW